MLRLSLVFLIIAMIAALFGFNIIEGYSFLAAKIAFFLFLVLFVVALLTGGRATRDVV
jgi:uncharacterized membrane protein YtjA (UPF0391 family)